MTGKVLRLGFFAFSLTSVGAQTRSPQHPLDALTTDEYWTVHDALEESGRLTERGPGLKPSAAWIRPINFFDKNPVLNLPHQP